MINQARKLILSLRTIFGFLSAEQQFGASFPVFHAEQLRMRRQRTGELYGGRSRLGSTIARTGQGDPITGRYELYKTHAENLGADFIEAFRTIIAPHCNHISSEAQSQLLDEMTHMYSHAIADAKRSDTAYVRSIGRPEEFEPFFRPTEGTYTSAMSTYLDILQSEIRYSNLKSSHTKLESRKQKMSALSIQVLSYVLTFMLGVLLGKWLAGK